MAIGLANNIKLRSMQLQNLDIRDMDAANDGYVRTAYAATVGDDGATIYGPVVDGEFLTLDSNGKLTRALGAFCPTKAFLCVGGAGRTDSMVTGKLSILYRVEDGFELDTKLIADYDGSKFAVNDVLTVGEVSFDGGITNKGVPIKHPDTSVAGIPVLGIVVATGTDFIRIRMGQV